MDRGERYSAPAVNIQAYEFIYFLEVTIRELISQEMSREWGSGWIRRLPEGVRARYAERKMKELETPIVSYAEYGPLYYTDFSDLAQIMENRQIWPCCFQQFFGSKERLINSLRTIESVRNKVAHNRIADSSDIDLLQSVKSQLVNGLGAQYASELFGQGGRPMDSALHVRELKCLLEEAVLAFQQHTADICLERWSSIVSSAWWQVVSLRMDVSSVENLRRLLVQYCSLPVGMPRYKREEWGEERGLEALFVSAHGLAQSLEREIRQ